MQNALLYFVIFMAMVVALGVFNEKVTKITYEIALMFFAMVLGIIGLFIEYFTPGSPISTLVTDVHNFNLESFLINGVLCFMLFSGSCHMSLKDFKDQARAVTVLSILATLLGAVFYGMLFYGVACLLGLGFSIPVCLMFGSIVAPTDPIAATSILNKFGLPERTSFLIEGESLLNDGVGVALFVCFSGMVRASAGGDNFFVVLGREIIGAVIVGVIVTFICYPIFSHTHDAARRIFVSMLAVSAIYLICEYLSFSGAIASVVCGVLFSEFKDKLEEKGEDPVGLRQYDTFWEILDNLLNSILYVILGLSFFYILQMPRVLVISLTAILCNLIGRSASVGICTFIMGPIPDGFNKCNFTILLTWGGLRGALCIALAMSTAGMIEIGTYHVILGATCAIVFFTTIVQGLTMKAVYRKIEKKPGR
ncbi:MAG: sodium:proton antiporter [Lachnospiraceae bacterium]|nr:sodium:proton antiporter [Lachnospiraceae bacterium]